MNIDLDTAIKLGSIFAGGVAGYSWVKFQVHQIWRSVSKLEIWKEKHEEFSSEKRSTYENTFAELKALMLVRDEQFKEIIRRIDEMNEKIDKIKTREE